MNDLKNLFQSELPLHEQRRLVLLRRWLARNPYDPEGGLQPQYDQNSNDTSGISFRIAPSIITRSEAELLGISAPRFALRATLFDSKNRSLGFVNLRRLRSFRDAVSRRLGLHLGHELMASLEHRVTCLADGLFDPRVAYPDFTVITTTLAGLYGEEGPECGVPFVTHFPIGGGLCAQAIAFQATLLRYRECKALFGVSEITLLANDDVRDNGVLSIPGASSYLNFSGLRTSQISAFFNHPAVGLGTTPQRLFYVRDAQARLLRWKAALLAFLGSGIPVIVTVDPTRMAPMFKHDFPAAILPRYRSDQPSQHCVLAVGFCRDSNEVLLNDPSTFPLLRCRIDDLYCMAPQQYGGPNDVLLPIHDAPGHLPLLDADKKEGSGLFEAINVFTLRHRSVNWQDSRWWYLRSDRDPVDDFSSRLTGPQAEDPSVMSVLRHARNWLLANAKQSPGQDPYRAWLEYSCDGWCRLWDAMQPPDMVRSATGVPWLVEFERRNCDDAAESPMTVICQTNRGGTAANTATSTSGNGDVHASPRLQAAVITSFCTAGIQMACRLLRRQKHKNLIELYVFMQPDCEKLLTKVVGYAGKETTDAVEMMAGFATDRAVRMFVRKLRNMSDEGFERIAALATFVPEVSDSPGSPRGGIARAAVEFIARLALEIRREQETQQLKTDTDLPGLRAVELVAGSRISAIYSAVLPDAPYPQLIAQTTSDREAAQNVIRNLYEALQRRGSTGKDAASLGSLLSQKHISLCLELEPGPLYALRDLDTLKTFCLELDRVATADTGGFPVGFNLDIAHWRMARIKPDAIPPEVQNRIGHSHIAGHDMRGHLGDIQIAAEDKDTFTPWLALLTQQFANTSRKISFSGLVSVEFEAAKHAHDVFSTLQTVGQWI